MMRVLVFAVLVLAMTACRSTKKIGTAISKKDTAALAVMSDLKKDSIAFMQRTLSMIDSARIDYTTFNAKMNIDYRGAGNKNYDLNATIRMYRDSAIWISANAVLGIEAMRAFITKDSVKILDKLNKTYTARSVDFLQEVASLPLDLKTLQDIFIGNPVFLDSNTVSYSNSNGAVTLLTVGEWFKNLLTVSENDYSLQYSKLDDTDIAHSRTAHLYYSDYENKKGPLFATKRRILVSEKKQLDIKLDFKQYDFNTPVSFPFSIPKNYERN